VPNAEFGPKDFFEMASNEKSRTPGKYFARFSDHRNKVFLLTKAGTSNPQELTEKLHTSLQRMNTSYIDMYFIPVFNLTGEYSRYF
jgi:aryl-alcohol dehydrogenase-like predicted oxidoreductase